MTRTRTFVVAVCLLAAADIGLAQSPTASGWVVLPVDQYRDLRSRAGQSPPSVAGAQATLSLIDYVLQVDGDVLRGRASLAIDVLGTGWAAVTLPAGLAVRQARLEGQPLVIESGPPPTVHLSRAGRSTLDLDVVFTPTADGGVDTIAIPASSAAVTRIVLTIPGTAHVLSATGGVVVERLAETDTTRWTVHGRATTPLTLSWARRRDDPRATEPLRLRARTDTVGGLRDALLQVSTTVQLEVLQGLARDLVVAVPAQVTVTGVTGAHVDDWRVDGDQLRVTFLEPVSSTASCVVRAEARLPATDSLSMPMLRVPAAERETGRVSIDVGGEAEVVAVSMAGLEALEGADKGPAASPRVRTFQLLPLTGEADRRLSFTIARYAPTEVPVATIDEARYRVLASASGHLLVEAQYLVRNNQRGAVTVTLPAGARLWQARVGGERLRPGAIDDTRVVVPLDAAPAGSEPTPNVVSLVYLDRQAAWTADTRVRLVLPALDLPVARTGLLLHHPPSTHLEAAAGPLRLTDDVSSFAAPMSPPPSRWTSPAVDDTRSGASAEIVALVNGLRREGPTAGAVVHDNGFGFPTIGPAAFLRGELMPDHEPLALDLVLRPSR